MRRQRKWMVMIITGGILVLYFLAHVDFLAVKPPPPSVAVVADASTPYTKDTSAGDGVDELKDLRQPYLMRYQPYHFVIRDRFHLPMPRLTLPIYDLIRRPWMEDLRNYLYKIRPNSMSSLINVVACDSKFKDVLLNWLIHAMVEIRPPLSHVLVLSLDLPLHTALTEKGFDSVCVYGQDFLTPETLDMLERSGRRMFHVAMISRLVVMRLMNHWGYDAANYDTDAIILKNPQHLYYDKLNSSVLIGSQGRYPSTVKAMFGLTLCAGVFMVKSTPQTERFWDLVSKVGQKIADDQERINTALTKMELVRDNSTIHWTATNHNGFIVTILNFTHVCRRNCIHKEISSYYVWHHGGKFSEGKIKRARTDHVWLLREDWNHVSLNTTALGVKWLRDMKN